MVDNGVTSTLTNRSRSQSTHARQLGCNDEEWNELCAKRARGEPLASVIFLANQLAHDKANKMIQVPIAMLVCVLLFGDIFFISFHTLGSSFFKKGGSRSCPSF